MVETHAYVREHAEDRACAADKLFCKWYIEARSYARKNAESRVWAAAKSFCEWQRRVPTGPTPGVCKVADSEFAIWVGTNHILFVKLRFIGKGLNTPLPPVTRPRRKLCT